MTSDSAGFGGREWWADMSKTLVSHVTTCAVNKPRTRTMDDETFITIRIGFL
jgi:hypothetical protein